MEEESLKMVSYLMSEHRYSKIELALNLMRPNLGENHIFSYLMMTTGNTDIFFITKFL